MSNSSNDKIDLIKGDPKKAIRTLAWPMILMLILNMVYNMVDRVWIAGLGSDPLAAIGFVTPLFIILGGIANGFGAGANSLISRYIGAEDKKNANNSGIHGVLIGIILSIIIPIILLPFLDKLLVIIGAGSVLKYASEYATIITLGSFTIILNGILSSQLRAEGDVKRATIALICTGVINLIIDPIFIYVLDLGVNGAAIATILSAFIATLMMIYWMFIKKDTYVNLSKDQFNFDMEIVKKLISVAIPASVEQLIISLISIIMNAMLIAVSTTTVVAAYTASWSIVQIAMMPAVGIGTATITVAGVSYGARDFDRLKESCYYSIKLGLLISIILVIIMELFAPQLAYIFSYSANSGNLGSLIAEILRIISLFIIGIPVGLSCAFVFQAMGKGTISLLLTLLRELILVIVFSYLLTFTFGLGEYGIYYGMVLGAIIGSLIGLLVFEIYYKKIKKFSY